MKIKFLLIASIFMISSGYSQEKWSLKKCVDYALENNISNKVRLVFHFQREMLPLLKVIFCQPLEQVLVEGLTLGYHQTKQEY